MMSRSQINVIASTLIILLLPVLFYTFRTSKKAANQGAAVLNYETKSDVAVSDVAVYLKQRVDMSRRMNSMMQVLAKQSCSIQDKGVEGHGNRGGGNAMVALTGGWCKTESTADKGRHLTDTGVIQGLNKLFVKKRVGSFGDGPGVYKRELLKLGQVKAYDAYDGAPFCEETSEGRVKYMDLTVPQYGVPIYDWVLSLEVAEHIPEKHEDQVIDNMVRHAREGVVLSWATPGQGGTGHINHRSHEYVIEKFRNKGFTKDVGASKALEKLATFQWFKPHPPWNKDQKDGNIQVFKRNADHPVDPLDA